GRTVTPMGPACNRERGRGTGGDEGRGLRCRSAVREEDAHGSALGEDAAGLDAPTMRLDEVLDDGQAEPGASLLARAAGVGPVEALENAGQVLGPDPRARVRHGDVHPPGC